MERTKIKRFFSFISNNNGLTLIEVLVAIVILAIGLLGVAMMQYMAIAGNAFGREMQIATELGQERLEIIKSVNYANVTAGMTNAGIYWWASEALSDANPSRFGGLTFTRAWWVVDNCRNAQLNDPDPNIPLCNPPATTASCTAGATMPNMRAIAVRVCWTDKHGGNHSVTLNGLKWDETATP